MGVSFRSEVVAIVAPATSADTQVEIFILLVAQEGPHLSHSVLNVKSPHVSVHIEVVLALVTFQSELDIGCPQSWVKNLNSLIPTYDVELGELIIDLLLTTPKT